MQNVSDVPVKQLVPPEATLAQVHQEGPTTKNGFLRVAEAVTALAKVCKRVARAREKNGHTPAAS